MKIQGTDIASLGNATGGNSTDYQSEALKKLKNHADALQTFRSHYPDHPAVPTARQMEAIALSFSVMRGDSSQESRRATLLKSVRSDPKLSPDQRFEAVAWSRQAEVTLTKPSSRAAFIMHQENVARELIKEFPEVPMGYESLLAVANDSEPTPAKKIVQDLQNMAAPPWVKAGAKTLEEQLRLVGQSLNRYLIDTGQSNLVTETKGRPVAMYTWSAADPAGLRQIAFLAKSFPSVSFVGVCLDADLVTARKAAASAKLPILQYYSTSGKASRLAEGLFLTTIGRLLLADRSGVIQTLNARNDSADQLAKVSR